MTQPEPSLLVETIRANMQRLSTAERKVARLLLANPPVMGLQTVAELARCSNVSGPTVLRLVKKLGFPGYSAFQAALRQELEARLSSPLSRMHEGLQLDPGDDYLEEYAEAVRNNILRSLTAVSRPEFRATLDLLEDSHNGLYLLGGRFTSVTARYAYQHLRILRSRVRYVEGQSATWVDLLLDLGKRDVLLVFDVRRYQQDVIHFSRQVVESGARVVLFTDPWISPIAEVASHVFPVPVGVPSEWDSQVAMLALIETLIAALSQRLDQQAQGRMERLELLRRPR